MSPLEIILLVVVPVVAGIAAIFVMRGGAR